METPKKTYIKLAFQRRPALAYCLKYRKYISNHGSENMAPRIPKDVELCLTALDKILKLAIQHATKTWQQDATEFSLLTWNCS